MYNEKRKGYPASPKHITDGAPSPDLFLWAPPSAPKVPKKDLRQKSSASATGAWSLPPFLTWLWKKRLELNCTHPWDICAVRYHLQNTSHPFLGDPLSQETSSKEVLFSFMTFETDWNSDSLESHWEVRRGRHWKLHWDMEPIWFLKQMPIHAFQDNLICSGWTSISMTLFLASQTLQISDSFMMSCVDV